MDALELLKIYASSTELTNSKFTSNRGSTVEIFEIRNIDTKLGVILADAKLSIEGERISGRIVFIERSSLWVENPLYFSENIFLLVCLECNGVCCDINANQIDIIEICEQRQISEKLQQLLSGASSFGCGQYIASLRDIDRVNLCTNLLIERVQLKSDEITEVLNENGFGWNETFYTTMMKMMGKGRNQQEYIRLSKIVPYKMISRERESTLAIEALLLGAAGFLDNPIDRYEMSLAKEFKHLQNKHSIRAMRKSDWIKPQRYNTRPIANPVLRIAQVAALVSSKDFMFDSAIGCRTPEDIYKLFDASASEYWDTHYFFGCESPKSTKSISKDTAEILGINVVCMMMFCYGKHTANEELTEAAFDLLDKLKAEKNSITAGWQNAGVRMENASFAQAMLQLYKIYCNKEQCSSCFIGKARMKSE